MTELIDKKNLFNNLFVRNGKVCPNNDINNFPTTIDVKEVKKAILEQPTTTEAEIRASVIDEFSEKLKESLVKNYRHFITTDTDGFDWLTTDAVGTHIDKVVDQLKEE